MPSGVYLRTEKHSFNKGKKHPNRKRYSRGITPINKVCLFCKSPFITNSRQPKKKYCNQLCAYKNNPKFTTLGKKGSDKQREVMRSRTGEKHHAWIKDRTTIMEKHRLRGTEEWSHWRQGVFTRDDFACQECNQRSDKLEPHHIIPLRVSMDNPFDIKNGITLCRPCHQLTIRKEELFIEKYSKIVSSKLTSL